MDNVLSWVFPETDPGGKTQVQVAYLGSDPGSLGNGEGTQRRVYCQELPLWTTRFLSFSGTLDKVPNTHLKFILPQG